MDLDRSQQQYNDDTSVLLETISNIITNGELTQEDKDNVSQLKTNYNESYSQVNADIDAVRNAQNNSDLNSIKNDLLGLKQLENKVEFAVNGTINNKEVTSKLEIEVGAITSTVEAQDGRITQAQQTADKFNWIVKNGSSASNMELTDSFLKIVTDEVDIEAPTINLEGYTTINGGFSVDEYGNMTAVNGTFTGGEISIGKRSSGNSYFQVDTDGSMRVGHVDQYGRDATMNFGNGGLYMNVYDSANNKMKTLYLCADGYEIGNTVYGDNYISPSGTLTIYGNVYVEGKVTSTTQFVGDVKGTLNGDVSSSNSYLYLGNSSNTLTIGSSSVHSAGSTLGYSGARWSTIYATNGEINTSDRTYKEDIKYIGRDGEFTYQDMYDFVKDDLYLATYKYKEIDGERRYMNFISQDLLVDEEGNDNVVGQFIVQTEESAENQTALGYSSMNYQGVLAGALKQSIAEIEELKSIVKQQQELINTLLSKQN